MKSVISGIYKKLTENNGIIFEFKVKPSLEHPIGMDLEDTSLNFEFNKHERDYKPWPDGLYRLRIRVFDEDDLNLMIEIMSKFAFKDLNKSNVKKYVLKGEKSIVISQKFS